MGCEGGSSSQENGDSLTHTEGINPNDLEDKVDEIFLIALLRDE